MRRDRKLQWLEEDCGENNQHVVIGKDNYLMSADGYLMPAARISRRPTCGISSRARNSAVSRRRRDGPPCGSEAMRARS